MRSFEGFGKMRFLREVIEVFNQNKTSWIGLVILLLIMVAVALLAPLLAPYNPVEQHILDRLQPPSSKYLLGTDQFGRDILSRVIWGARISLVIGVSSILLGLVIGGAFGLIAGYKGGATDNIIMRVMDVFMSFPTLIMGLLVVAVLGASMLNLIVAIALTVVPRFARIARAPTVAVKQRDFVEAIAGHGVFRPAHHGDPHPAEHHGRNRGDGLAVDRHCGPHRSLVEFYRPGRQTADPDLGRHDSRRIRFHTGCPLAVDLPGSGNPDYRFRLQYAGRWFEGRHRPETTFRDEVYRPCTIPCCK